MALIGNNFEAKLAMFDFCMSSNAMYKRLIRLNELIGKAAINRKYGAEPGPRLTRWMDEYDAIREQHNSLFRQYCANVGADQNHRAIDLLA